MAELKKKIQTGNGQRLFVRGVITKVKELLPADLELGPDVKFKLEAHRISLEKQLKPIQTLDSEIAELLDADSIEKETLEALDFEEAIQESICWIDAVLSCGKSDPGDVTNVSSSHNSSVMGNEGSSNPQSTSNQSSSQKKVKLPKLSLPNFHGSVTISRLTLSSANYHQAIELLQKRYSNKQVIITHHMDVLIKLAPVKSSAELDKL